jgi:hypothetical protein
LLYLRLSMTAIADKFPVAAGDFVTLSKIVSRSGVGTMGSEDDYDTAITIRNKWSSDDPRVGSIDLPRDFGGRCQGYLNLMNALWGYMRNVLSRGATAVNTILGSTSLSPEDLDDVRNLINQGVMGATPALYNAAVSLQAIMDSWAGKWPATMSDYQRSGLENVMLAIMRTYKSYDNVALQLSPDRVIQSDANAMGIISDKFNWHEIITPASTSAAENYSVGGIFKNAVAAGSSYLDQSDIDAVWFMPGATGTNLNLFRLASYAQGYTIEIELSRRISKLGVNHFYTHMNGAVTLTEVNIGVAQTLPEGFTIAYTYAGQVAATIEKMPMYNIDISSISLNGEMYTYTCTVEIPDIARTAQRLTVFNDTGGAVNGLWSARVNQVYASGAGSSNRAIYQKNGTAITDSTRLVSMLGNLPSFYVPVIFNSDVYKLLQLLVCYDNYRAKNNIPTVSASIRQSYNALQTINGDTLVSTTLTSQRVFDLGFWLTGAPGITNGTLQTLYRTWVSQALMTWKLSLADQGFLTYYQNAHILGDKL